MICAYASVWGATGRILCEWLIVRIILEGHLDDGIKLFGGGC